jgi:hypothetical protein
VFNAFYNQQPNFQNDRYLAVIGTLGTVSGYSAFMPPMYDVTHDSVL